MKKSISREDIIEIKHVLDKAFDQKNKDTYIASLTYNAKTERYTIKIKDPCKTTLLCII